MAHIPFLPELVLILGAGVLAAVAVAFLRLPAVAGFMLAGAVVGPHGLGLVGEGKVVEVLAEIGVVLLLFTIGLELSLEGLRRIWRYLAIGGALQVGLTTLIAVLISSAFGEPLARGVFFGFLVALSSTAIVLRGLTERGEMDSPHGRFVVGALIFQDLCIVPMMLLVPILGGHGEGHIAVNISLALLKAAAVVTVTLVAGRLLVPRVLARVESAKSQEIFLIAVLVVCTGIALTTAYFGLSLALGAFLAGMLLAESDFGHRAMANVLPLRDLLTSLFFLSLGMLFDPAALKDAPLVVALLFVALFFGKGLIATLASLAMRFPARVAWLAGVGLAQFGEFGFVLAKEGTAVGLLDDEESRILLSAGLLTMFVTPLSMRLAPHVTAGAVLLRPLERLLGARGIDEPEPQHASLKGHIVIAGYGLAGQTLSTALKELGIRYLVIDLGYDNVRAARELGEPVYYGDATHDEALLHAGVRDAEALVVLITDVAGTRQAVAAARKLAPQLPILARARRLDEVHKLREIGASDVVSEEAEGGIEMLARVLRVKGTPVNVLGPLVQAARDRVGHSARDAVFRRSRIGELRDLDGLKVEPVLVTHGMSAVGETLVSLDLRSKSGASVVALRRQGRLLEDVPPGLPFEEGDLLYLAGQRESVYRALEVLELRAAPSGAAREDDVIGSE